MVAGLVSTFNEGRLAVDAVRSLLPAVDRVLVFDGPIAGASEDQDWQRFTWPHKFSESNRVMIRASIGSIVNDAAKRTELLQWAQQQVNNRRQIWVVVLDGDEILLWGEYLPAMIERAEAETAAGGFALRLVELDGSVSLTRARVFRGDLIERYVTSGFELQPFGSAITLSLGNEFLWRPGDTPDAIKRPPLQGEPHILHRSLLRHPARLARRLNELEGEAFQDLEREAFGRVLSDGT